MPETDCPGCGIVYTKYRPNDDIRETKTHIDQPKTAPNPWVVYIAVVALVAAGLFAYESYFSVNRASKPAKTASRVKSEGEIRLERIAQQFSGWDGAHINLKTLIKNTMNDPKSFEHVKTTYKDRNDHLIVEMHYRGKNVFGGVVTRWVFAMTDLNGNVLQILSEGP